MDAETFNQIFEYQMGKVESTLSEKGNEYDLEFGDRLRSFRSAANLQRVSMKQALAGMMVKHTVSIYGMCASEEEFELEKWDEKITDHINYLFMLAAVVRDDLESKAAPAEAKTNNFVPDDVIAAFAGLRKVTK